VVSDVGNCLIAIEGDLLSGQMIFRIFFALGRWFDDGNFARLRV
jgi:hypothetical protein